MYVCVIALFTSLVGPFGGFLASGMKRAYQIKDFATTLPGHGGFTDRFDCHSVIIIFAYILMSQVLFKEIIDYEDAFMLTKSLPSEEKKALIQWLTQLLQ